MSSTPAAHLSPEVAAYYANKPQMWRNVAFVQLANFGWTLCFVIVTPMMQLKLNSSGLGEAGIGLINSINTAAVSFLVMYFSWKSDHTVTKLGRRLPYFLIATPIIALSIILFPFFNTVTILVIITVIQMLAMDLKASTFPLLNIDCVTRDVLARVNSLTAIVLSVTSFFALRYGMRFAETNETLTYLSAAAILLITSGLAILFIKEPPIRTPQTEPFKPWSALKVGWKVRSNILLMLGVGTVNAMMVVYTSWVWLFAKNALGLSRSDTGDVLSWAVLITAVIAYPVGWVIDRFGSYPVIIFYYLVQVFLCVALINVLDAQGLLLAAILAVFAGPLYQAADILVFKAAPPEDVGSVTSSNAFLRNIIASGLLFVSGRLIEGTGGYVTTFILGIVVSTIGVFLLFFHRHRYGRLGQNLPPEIQ